MGGSKKTIIQFKIMHSKEITSNKIKISPIGFNLPLSLNKFEREHISGGDNKNLPASSGSHLP